MLSTDGSARAHLRRETRPDHEAVDAVYSRFDLSRLGDYRRFLRAQASCLGGLEAALDERAGRLVADWPARRRAAFLYADLRELGDEPDCATASQAFDSDAAALGGVYVLEGSRLGGAVLAKQVRSGAPRRFLSPPRASGSWARFVDLLDRTLRHETERAAAVRAARSVFRSFEMAGRQELERPLAG